MSATLKEDSDLKKMIQRKLQEDIEVYIMGKFHQQLSDFVEEMREKMRQEAMAAAIYYAERLTRDVKVLIKTSKVDKKK